MTSEMFHWTYAAITQGLIIGFCTAALIGPVNFLAIRRGMLGGFQPAFLVGAGAALVDASCAYLVFAGISKVGFTGVLKHVLFGFCVVFLLYLAYGALADVRENPEMMANSKIRKQLQFLEHPFIMGFLLAASNPFTLLYWIGMVGTLHLSMEFYKDLDLAGGAPTSFFSAVLVSELVWFSGLGLGLHYSRNLFNRKALKRITWCLGLLLLAYYLFMAGKVFMNLINTGGAPLLQ